MTTIRVKKDARYFSASNEPFNDKRLSWEARGLMGYLLSKPDNWEVRSADLEEQGPAGSRKVKRMLAELRICGYMNRIRTKMPDGKFVWTTEVYESPSQNPRPSKGFTKTSGAKCTSAIPTSAKEHHILSTNSLKTDQPALEQFRGYFGKFLSEKELLRWLTIFEAVGQDKADRLAVWAFKREIHLTNRGGLLDSLETAAKNWHDKPARKEQPAPSNIPDMDDFDRQYGFGSA
jgi:hypothetical protein